MTAHALINGVDTPYDESAGAWGIKPGGVCPKCGKPPCADGRDACLPVLRGAISACCGHGLNTSYVHYPDVETMLANVAVES